MRPIIVIITPVPLSELLIAIASPEKKNSNAKNPIKIQPGVLP